MTKHITAALLAALLAAPAVAQQGGEPPLPPVNPPLVYVVNIWQAPGQYSMPGVAITVGPMTQQQCAHMQKFLASLDLPIPPEMQLRISNCVAKERLGLALAWGGTCRVQEKQNVPKLPDARLWIYNCVMVY